VNYILEHLAVGSPLDAEQYHVHFDAFLNVAAEVQMDASLFGDRPYRHIAIEDMKPIPPALLQEAVTFLNDHVSHNRVLVLCDGGVGRSPSTVVAYLCSKGMRFGQAVEFVAVRKPYMSILPELIESIRKSFARPQTPVLRLDPFSLPSKPTEPEIIPTA